MKWDVAHITSAEHGGAPTLANVGAAHQHCNRKAGGKRGAQITNRHRSNSALRSKGLRSW